MRNPLGKNTGMKNPVGSKRTEGKLSQVFGKKGETKKYIVGGK